MNIAMMTTWNSNCGIAEYSANLVKEYLKMRDKNNILLLTNKVHNGLDIHARLQINPVFGVYWWGEDPTFQVMKAKEAIKIFEEKYGKIDVLHVQYQSSLYQAQGFNELMNSVNVRKVITVHDSSYNSAISLVPFDAFIMHNRVMKIRESKSYFIWDFPTIMRRPRIFSFGMGRNDYDFLQEVCNEMCIDFDSHDSRKDGWLTESSLFARMNESDVIVLWYNDVTIQGQSAALRTAISSHRPVIVNNIGWFSNAPGFVSKVNNKEELKQKIAELLHFDYIKRCSFANLAVRHMEVYRG